MYDHIGLKVKDLDRAARFFEAALTPLGHALCYKDETWRGFGPKSPAFYLSPGAGGKGVHIAFSAPSRAAVDRFHKEGLAAGGRDNGAPGLRPDYAAGYYAAFLIDPDGNNVEAVCVK
ncbi:VOC family protein [Parvibaculum sedimenti]|uniref:VOC family protein n=1 Tax=Parvibaculum sedimenti TaxID=2608632 RepID=A0A6N6VPA3_9HYPH|nr:VOC family protein [Parvibaculum sedimenti]KAB7740714.1 VOC family protein [Parvibaculum sedimenti]